MKIWLDDERDPKEQFIKDNFGSLGDEIWVKTVQEAIDLILKNNIESISFDHDLCQEKNGYDLAKWLEEKAFKKEIKPIKLKVHSQNSVGRKNINFAIENCYRYWGEIYN